MRFALLSALILVACGGSPDDTSDDAPDLGDDDSGDDGGDDGGDATCSDSLYGNGLCDLSLACGIPDIDCFATYASDAEAQSWYLTEYYDAFLGEPRYAGAPLPASDPRVQRARMLTDRVWDRFPDAVKLGALGSEHLAVIVIDNPTVNAFALANLAGKSSLSVQFLAGILDSGMSDAALEAVIAHELGHVVGLHAFEDVYYAVTKYYVADGEEPIGALQTNDPAIQLQHEDWGYLAYDVGYDRQASLGDIPLGGLGGVYTQALTDRAMADNVCYTQASDLRTAYYDIAYAPRALDDGYDMSTSTALTFTSAYSAFRTCYQGQPYSWSSFSQELFGLGYDATYFLRDEESGLMGSNALVVLETITGNRRDEMKTIEQAFQTAHDATWDRLRWYTTEEQADDYAVEYSREAGLAVPGVAGAAETFLKERVTACDQARAANNAPYGKYLYDDHHGWCWRRDHAYRYDDYAASRANKKTIPAWREAFRPTRPVSREPIH